MAEIGQIVRRLQKKKDVDFNLEQYVSNMYQDTYDLSSIRLTLNFPTFYEMYRDKQSLLEIPECIETLSRRYVAIAANLANYQPEMREELLQAIVDLREYSTELMQVITTFADRFSIYEYVLNRIEYNFREDPNAGIDMEVFRQKLLAYITADKDGNASRMRMTEVIEQLPMRMSRSRFFEVLKNGLSVYKGSEQQSVKDVIDMIRTCAMLSEPEGFRKYFPDLNGVLFDMDSSSFSDLTEENYQMLLSRLTAGLQALNAYMDISLMIQELINDTYVVILSAPYVEEGISQGLFQKVVETLSFRMMEEKWDTLENEFFADYDSLMGKQEASYAKFNTGESALEDFAEMYEEKINQRNLKEAFEGLRTLSRLLSGSVFATLRSEIDATIAESQDIDRYYEDLAGELREVFKIHPKNINRAVMAKILTHLPPFITRYDDLESYIETSLMGCRDANERAACVEILSNIMEGNGADDKEQ
ncbi:MAG: hypothetical protein ACI4C1_00795 [Lachnospiraceae bacterium]